MEGRRQRCCSFALHCYMSERDIVAGGAWRACVPSQAAWRVHCILWMRCMQASTAAMHTNTYFMDEYYEVSCLRVSALATATATGNESNSLTLCNNRAHLFHIAAPLGQPGGQHLCYIRLISVRESSHMSRRQWGSCSNQFLCSQSNRTHRESWIATRYPKSAKAALGLTGTAHARTHCRFLPVFQTKGLKESRLWHDGRLGRYQGSVSQGHNPRKTTYPPNQTRLCPSVVPLVITDHSNAYRTHWDKQSAIVCY